MGKAAPGDIDKLWKEYETAQKEDRPQKQLQILRQIKQESVSQRRAWDFYRASDNYLSVASSMDWKQRDKLEKEQREEIEAFGESVLTLYYRLRRSEENGLYDFVQANRQELEKGCNKEFHQRDSRLSVLKYKDALTLDNDYVYALWTLASIDSWRSSTERDKAIQALEDYYKDQYPQAALVEYRKISTG